MTQWLLAATVIASAFLFSPGARAEIGRKNFDLRVKPQDDSTATSTGRG